MTLSRRTFLQSTAALAAASSLRAAEGTKPPKLLKAVKYGMIREGNSFAEKFALIKRLGFEGVEIDSPSKLDLKEANAAQQSTGIVIHGVIDSVHWGTRFSDSDAAVRSQAVKALHTALDDAKFVGATTVLIVPAKVTNPETENFQQCWERSQACIREVIPHAAELGVKIAVETVWNDFITTPEQLIKYVDELQSPYVGAYFDCSNMLKYGVSSPEWIRKLGKRMFKFDFKGYSLELAKQANDPRAGFKAKIGEGSENWPEILKALDDVGYTGWATAEVGGGGEDVLRDISQRMDRILGRA